jgi:hypothetical protein
MYQIPEVQYATQAAESKEQINTVYIIYEPRKTDETPATTPERNDVERRVVFFFKVAARENTDPR